MSEMPQDSEIAAADGITPMMAQYLAIKGTHPDYLLFYRMGDFYELFFADAAKASEALDIALTKRGRHLGDDIPMCGVPVMTAEAYLEKLIRKGHRVAVCEQVEDPAEAKKRGSKSVVKREVVRLVTPGTLTEDALLEARASNILAALGQVGGRGSGGGSFALAAADMSTGSFEVSALGEEEIAAELARLSPRELLLPDALVAHENFKPVFGALKIALSPLPASRFDSDAGARALQSHYGLLSLDGLGHFSRAELSAAGALIAYVDLTQKGRKVALRRLGKVQPSQFVGIDAATRRNLELEQTLSGARGGSLLATIDRSVTASGARLLASRLAAPLTDIAAIAARQDAVQGFAEDAELRRKAREHLRAAPDMARALARISVGRGGPRDLAALRDGVKAARKLRDELKQLRGEAANAHAALTQALADLSPLSDRLAFLLVDEPPYLSRDGGFIVTGAHAPLDELRQLRDESRRVIAGLEGRYRGESGVSQLRIKHNGVLGYFIEVAQSHADRLMSNRELFRHRQTMAGAVRFSTDELASLASRIAEAAQSALALETALFNEMCELALTHGEPIAAAAEALAVLDVASALAELAVAQRYVRPLVDGSLAFNISRGRHPVVEAALGAAHAGPFVANDCDLSPEAPKDKKSARLWFVTGPNMAGKSTFLRQNALIALLAQMGSFVPAQAAHIGVIDRLFSRVGAGDDLAAGRSTFMVEMVETAAILNQATDRSLVILDEIGRGTATYDGLAIAWAAAEHLHETNRSRALFATHYHELVALCERLDRCACVTMRVKEWNESIVFLHEVTPGAADRSYGIHVAKLAGLPAAVIGRAQGVLAALEEGREGHKPLARIDELPLFGAAAPALKKSEVEDALRGIEPDALTPKQALEALYELKKKLKS